MACFHSLPDLAVRLLVHGADMMARDAAGITPLHMAVMSRCLLARPSVRHPR